MSLSSLFARFSSGTSVPAIEHDEMQKICLEGTHAVIDVREPHEYAGGHIPGAVNMPLSRFEPASLPQDKPVALVCLSGARSARALQQALAAGRKDIRHYPHGTAGWHARGGTLARPKHGPGEL